MSNTNPIGFVCGTKGDSVAFLVNKDVCLSFGQIVRIESNERNFYARVVNSESSSTLELIEQLREAEGKEAFGPYSAYRNGWTECVLPHSIQIIGTKYMPLATKIAQSLNSLGNLKLDVCVQQINSWGRSESTSNQCRV